MSEAKHTPLATPDIGGVPVEGSQPIVDPEHGLPPGFGAGWAGRLLFWIAVAFSLFQIATAFNVPLDHRLLGIDIIDLLRAAIVLWAVAIVVRAVRGKSYAEMLLAWIPIAAVVEILARFEGSVPNQVLRALHVGMLCLVAGGLLAQHKSHSRAAVALAWALALAGFAIGLYHWFFYEDLVARAGELTQSDLVVGIAVIVVLFVVCWRFMGPALPIVARAHSDAEVEHLSRCGATLTIMGEAEIARAMPSLCGGLGARPQPEAGGELAKAPEPQSGPGPSTRTAHETQPRTQPPPTADTPTAA